MRIALAPRPPRWSASTSRLDLGAAMEAVMISREQDRAGVPRTVRRLVPRPRAGQQAAGPDAAERRRQGRAVEAPAARARGAAPRRAMPVKPAQTEREVDFDAAMTASDRQRAPACRLQRARRRRIPAGRAAGARHRAAGADAAGAPAARDRRRAARIRACTGPACCTRRRAPAARCCGCRGCARREQPLPLLVLVDVSGSMERYARLLLAFLHAATRRAGPARRVRLRHPPDRPDAGLPHRRHRRDAGRGQRRHRRLRRRHAPGRIAGRSCADAMRAG